MRLAVVTNAPAPYRIPLFERLAGEEGVETLVLFDGASDSTTRASGLRFPHEHLAAGVGLRRRSYQDEPEVAERSTLRFSWGYLPRLAAFRPDVVISGEFGWRTLHVATHAALARIPLIVWWEGTPYTERHVDPLRRALRRALARRAAGLLGFGEGSVDYLRSIAPRGAPVDFVPQAVDNAWFAREVDRERARRDSVRASLGARGQVLLCASRLLPHKGIRELLSAVARLDARTPADAFTLLLAGDGPLRGEAERVARSLSGRLRVLGGVHPDALPRLLAAADALVFPTLRDCWGMVVNEALAAGIPVLGSRYGAASQELLTRETLGVRFDPYSPESFDDALRRAVVERRWSDGAAEERRRALAGHTPEAAARALLAAARRSVRDRGAAHQARTGGSGPRRRRSSRAAS